MVRAVLADVNIEGHVDFVMALVQAAPWSEFWQALGLGYLRFSEVGLDPGASDADIWQLCQNAGYVLVTNNRNEDDADSLQATIRVRNTEQSLPVLTIGDTERLRNNRDYAQRVAEGLVDALLRIEELRGTARLYLP
ncbi:MAG TPA: DUF5615 family PIN-like protein [Pirellulales bacterium]|nr:DUF5615 family PIN-like protein [Pirellulales bacterium]